MPSSDRSREDTLVVPHLTSPSTNTLGRRRSHAVKNLQMILNECVTAYMRASILAYWRMLLRRGCRLKTVRQAWSQKARLLPTPTAETTAKAIPAGRAESTICTCRLHMRPWRRPNILDYALGPSVVFAFSSRSMDSYCSRSTCPYTRQGHRTSFGAQSLDSRRPSRGLPR